MAKRKTVFLSLVLVLVAILSGCTGFSLDANQQWTLDDLYMASTGVMVHIQAGQYVADVAKANGAYDAGVNLRVPYTRLVADVWAKYSDRRSEYWRMWEIKPDKYHFNGKLSDAGAQLMRYVNSMKKAGYSVRQWQPSGVYFPPPGTAVPDEYTPEAYSRCLQVILFTRFMEDAPGTTGIIGYRYRWHPTKKVNGKNCKDQDKKTKNQYLAGFAADAAEWVKDKHGFNQGQYMMAVTAKETDIAAIRQQLVDVETLNGEGEWIIDWETTKAEVHKELMGKVIPNLFRDLSNTQIPFPGVQRGNGESYWTCDKKAC